MDFLPPIASRATAELLKMAVDAWNWQPEARALARMELDDRGIPAEATRSREEEFQQGSRALTALHERHAQESHPARQLLGIFLTAPLLIIA